MNVLIFGPKERYDVFMPDFVAQLPVDVAYWPATSPPLEGAKAHPDTEVLFTDTIVTIDAQVMDAMPRLRLIHSEGVAFHCIDLAAARERNIFVCHNKGCNAASVAEHTIMLMLMALRYGITGHYAVRAGLQMEMKELVMASRAPELGLSTVGLVGFGDIAQATALRLRPFGCSVVYYSLHRRPPEVEASFGVTYLPLEELVAHCDIISLHCAVNDQTRNLFNAPLIARMKRHAILVNTARGDLVDNLALRQALIEGRIGGIAMDTLAPEPTPADHPLVALPEEIQHTAIYSPHLGGNTAGSFTRAHSNMWSSVRLVLDGKRPNFIVNGL